MLGYGDVEVFATCTICGREELTYVDNWLINSDERVMKYFPNWTSILDNDSGETKECCPECNPANNSMVADPKSKATDS